MLITPDIATRPRARAASSAAPAFDPRAYRERDVVERSFARLKQLREIATRLDELAARYTAGGEFASLILRLRESQP